MRGQGTLIRKHRASCKLTGLHARCSCPYAVGYRDQDANRSKSFSTRKLAEDFQAQLLRDTRAGERTFSTQASAGRVQ